jgi:hypothetical protein
MYSRPAVSCVHLFHEVPQLVELSADHETVERDYVHGACWQSTYVFPLQDEKACSNVMALSERTVILRQSFPFHTNCLLLMFRFSPGQTHRRENLVSILPGLSDLSAKAWHGRLVSWPGGKTLKLSLEIVMSIFHLSLTSRSSILASRKGIVRPFAVKEALLGREAKRLV